MRISRKLATTTVSVGALILVAAVVTIPRVCCQDSVRAAGAMAGADSVEDSPIQSLFVDAEGSFASGLDGKMYTYEVRSGSAAFFHDGLRVDHVPADFFARAGQRYYARVTPDNSAKSTVFVDTDEGVYNASAFLSGRLADLLLLGVSIVFALAFFITGFFLLRVARQRRQLSESRIRQLRAREAERTHLAAELHDGPVQELQHVMRSYVSALGQTANRNALNIRDIQAKLENVTVALRNICTELRPPVLAHFGLAYAMRSYADKYEHRLPQTLLHIDVRELDHLEGNELSLAFFRIFQESLSNIEKHANASNVWVDIHIDSKWVEMVIRDDGIGFNPPGRLEDLEEQGHLGLSGLAQRAAAVGGVFDVRSSQGNGTTIRVVARRPNPEHRGPMLEGVLAQ